MFDLQDTIEHKAVRRAFGINLDSLAITQRAGIDFGRMKSLILIALLLIAIPTSVAQKNPRLPNLNVTTSYDRFKDITTVRYKGGYLKGAVPRMSFDLFASAVGTDLSRVENVRLFLTSDSDDWVFLRSANVLRVIVDKGKPFEVGMLKRNGETYKGRVIETLFLEVPIATVEKLAAAMSVEMQVSQTEFELTAGQISDLKDFIYAVSGKDVRTP